MTATKLDIDIIWSKFLVDVSGTLADRISTLTRNFLNLGCSPLCLENNILVISTNNQAVAMGLKANAGDLLTNEMRKAFGISDLTIMFEFSDGWQPVRIMASENLSPPVEFFHSSPPSQASTAASLEIEFDTGLYDQIVHPTQAVAMSGYFLRHVRRLGPELAWMAVGIWQSAFHARRTPGQSVEISASSICQYSGLSPSGFQKIAAREKTWELLSGIVTRDASPRWDNSGNTPRRLPLKYTLAETLPLTPHDTCSLRQWLIDQAEHLGGIDLAVKAALSTSRAALIPWQANLQDEPDCKPTTVADLVKSLGGDAEHGEMLQLHLMPPSDLLLIRLYFLRTWLPRMTPGAAWMVTWLRDRGFRNKQILGTAKASREEIAGVLGVTRIKTVRDWLDDPVVKYFVHEQEPAWRAEAPTVFVVNQLEPIPDDDFNLAQSGVSASTNLAQSGVSQKGNLAQSGVSDSTNLAQSNDQLGAKWRVLSLINLKPLNQSLIDSYTSSTTSENARSKNEKNQPQPEAAAAVLSGWDLPALLTHNRVARKHLENLKGASGNAFVSWLLFGAANERVQAPVALAISKLTEAPNVGAGGGYDQLAELDPEELAEIIQDILKNPYYSNPPAIWQRVMSKTVRERIAILTDQLNLESYGEESDSDDY